MTYQIEAFSESEVSFMLMTLDGWVAMLEERKQHSNDSDFRDTMDFNLSLVSGTKERLFRDDDKLLLEDLKALHGSVEYYRNQINDELGEGFSSEADYLAALEDLRVANAILRKLKADLLSCGFDVEGHAADE